MKKIFFAAVALLFSANAMALDNEPEEGVTTVAYLGMNVTNIRNSHMDPKVGGVFGVKFDYVLPHAHGTYITAGLDWTMKGSKMDLLYGTAENEGVDATNKYRLHYIELPVRVGFRYNLDKQLGFYGEFGPYFAVGVGGKSVLDIDKDGNIWTQKEDEASYKLFKSSTTLPNFQRWDCGLGFRLGAEYNQHYNVTLGCDWGVTDMYRNKYRDAEADKGFPLNKVKNFNFTIAFGYRF